MPRRIVRYSSPGDNPDDVDSVLVAAWHACVAGLLTVAEYQRLLDWFDGCEQQLAASYETFGHVHERSLLGRVVSRIDGILVGGFSIRLIARLRDEQTVAIVSMPSDPPIV